MERSGRRQTISTLRKSFPARSRIVGRVSGKSIIVPRMASLERPPAACASYHQSRYAPTLRHCPAISSILISMGRSRRARHFLPRRRELLHTAARVAEALVRRGFNSASHERGDIEVYFCLLQFFRAGVQRRRARQKHRTAIVERLGGDFVGADLACQGEHFLLVIA